MDHFADRSPDTTGQTLPQLEPDHLLQRRWAFWQTSPQPFLPFVQQHLHQLPVDQIAAALDHFEAMDREHAQHITMGAAVRHGWFEAWQPHPDTWLPTRQPPEQIVLELRLRAQGLLAQADLYPHGGSPPFSPERQWLDGTPWYRPNAQDLAVH